MLWKERGVKEDKVGKGEEHKKLSYCFDVICVSYCMIIGLLIHYTFDNNYLFILRLGDILKKVNNNCWLLITSNMSGIDLFLVRFFIYLSLIFRRERIKNIFMKGSLNVIILFVQGILMSKKNFSRWTNITH